MLQPKLTHLLRQLVNRYHWANRLEVAQQSVARIHCQLTRTRIAVQGQNNYLEVPDSSTLKHTDILVRGDENRFIIGERVYVDGNFASNNIWGD